MAAYLSGQNDEWAKIGGFTNFDTLIFHSHFNLFGCMYVVCITFPFLSLLFPSLSYMYHFYLPFSQIKKRKWFTKIKYVMFKVEAGKQGAFTLINSFGLNQNKMYTFSIKTWQFTKTLNAHESSFLCIGDTVVRVAASQYQCVKVGFWALSVLPLYLWGFFWFY